MALWREIGDQTASMTAGKQQHPEAMLFGQAVALESIFTSLAKRAAVEQWLPQFETNMRLALKAQSQCRATLQTLFEMKNPRPVAFVQQANIANGPQQINNGTPARAEDGEKQSNELLAVKHEHSQRMDSRTPRTAAPGDPAMAPVAEVNRPWKRVR